MTGEYESLEKVLRTIEAEKDLNLNNIIEKIQEELKEQDQGLYKEWEKGAFDVNHGFSLNISGIEYSKFPLLIIAARNGYTKTVGVLLGVGADINEKDSFSCTALCHAALCGRKEIVEFLISKEADVNVKGSFGCTVLHNAALYGCKEIVEFLTSKGADVNAKDVLNRTALHHAALYGRKEVVEFLISKGADVNAKDKSGRTALHDATRKEIVEVLLIEKANVNAVDRYGKTPLDYAKNQDVVKALLDAAFVQASKKAMIAGGVNTLLGTAIAVALFTTGIITAELIPIVIAVVAVTAAALVVGCATYELLKPSTKVGEAEEPSAALINGQQGVTSIPS
uniref:Ankyrin repeat domain-containing protein n=1 Tax=Wolbachia endosymbiont of Oeneis ivallda TaxID=3171168 RepID=A0AAU7YM53_9RICK